ncbi:MAG: SAM-dependent DNA methyltransferase [Clostridia bacterium]|nr:SAM-dependent DNA methyltransferase [Clostridia bacterium]
MSLEQIKSKDRVRDKGEVFTNKREVNAMLDLVKQETERIDSKFLEPACGNGNFLIEILKRKLEVVKSRYKKSQWDYERNALIAIMSIYGIDIMQDNVFECIQRLYNLFLDYYKLHFKKNIKFDYLGIVKFVLSKNILCGDALSMKTDQKDPIIFAEWSFVKGSLVQRRDFKYEQLMTLNQNDTFLGDFIEKPIKDYPLTHYLKLKENETND